MSIPDSSPQILIAIPAVILACQAGARLSRRLGQQPVIGEIVVGVMLGPSLLGWLWPQAQQWLLPAEVLPFTKVLGTVGLLIFMFLVGLELNLTELLGHRRVVAAVSLAGTVLPLALGALLALAMYGTFAPDGVSKTAFVSYIAVAMSITAFPVLARILVDRGLQETPFGALAMACAAVTDVASWCLLAVVVAVGLSGSPAEAVTTALLTIAFVAVMVSVVRPLLARWTARVGGRAEEGTLLAVLFSGLCLSALVTEWIGVHAIFGAFLFGVITPRGSRPVERSAAGLRAVAMPVLVPLFFVSTGIQTDITHLVHNPAQLLWALAVLAVAMVSKWGGSAGAARVVGQSWRDAMLLGALMNCRGLTELMLLDIGLEYGVITPELFTILVLMAVLTTAVTSPAISRSRTSAPPVRAHDDRNEPEARSTRRGPDWPAVPPAARPVFADPVHHVGLAELAFQEHIRPRSPWLE